ncbi:MAG: hypothetical protein K1X66_00400 [Verrucomicrobiae bacterium]|nr:hypothetical protein [Verrucomicrobiae bacterium]
MSEKKKSALWQSGMILAAANFLVGLGNYLFQGVMGRQLSLAEFGLMNGALGLMGFLSLPVLAFCLGISHYLAHYRGQSDEIRLNRMLQTLKRGLLGITLGSSVLAIILVQPLSYFFHFPRFSLGIAVLVIVLINLWANVVIAFCSGMGWFKRLALVSLVGVILRLFWGWRTTALWPYAEWAIYATAVSALSNLLLLVWYRRPKEKVKIPHSTGHRREFLFFLIATASFVFGNYTFSQGDILVAQRYFGEEMFGKYTGAGLFGRALVYFAGPLLVPLFISRSEKKEGGMGHEQKILLILYSIALVLGALSIGELRHFLIQLLFNRAEPDAALLVGKFAWVMALVAFLQPIAMWALASRHFKIIFFYGAFGGVYWLLLFFYGRTPNQLLATMGIVSGISLIILTLIARYHGKRYGKNL